MPLKGSSRHIKAPPRQRKRGRETEQKLLEAANQVFWAHGFSGSTVAQIVEESELSVGSYYHRFADKDELLAVAMVDLLGVFEQVLETLDLSAEVNRDLFTVFYRLSMAGRLLISQHRGIYRAATELAQTDFSRFGPMINITPAVIARVQAEMDGYTDQLSEGFDAGRLRSAAQLVAMTAMHTELGLGPLFPEKLEDFATTIARAACGIMGYSGQTAGPSVDIPLQTPRFGRPEPGTGVRPAASSPDKT